MGAPPSLPFFTPQQVPAVPGSRPTLQEPISGTLPYRMPAAAGFAQGLSSFVDSYHASKASRESYYQDKFWNAIKARMIGLGSDVDDQKLMQWAERGGIPIPKHPAGQMEYERQSQDYQKRLADYTNSVQAQAAQGAGYSAQLGAALKQKADAAAYLSGGGSTAPAIPGIPESGQGQFAQAIAARPYSSMPQPPQQLPLAPAPGQAPIPPSMQRPGLGARIGSIFGFGAPAGANQEYDTKFLHDLTKASQEGSTLPQQITRGNMRQRLMDMFEKENISAQTVGAQNMGLLQKEAQDMILHPEHGNWPLLERFGLTHDLGAMHQMLDMADDFFPGNPNARQLVGRALWYQASGRQNQDQMMWDRAMKLAPSFGNDPIRAMKWQMDWANNGYSEDHPGQTAEQTKALFDAGEAMHRIYPGLPASITMQPVMDVLAGNDPTASLVQIAKIGRDPKTGKQDLPFLDINTSGGMDMIKFSKELQIKAGELGVHGYEATTGRMKQQTDAERLVNEQKDLALRAWNAIREKTKDTKADAWKVINDPNSTVKDVNAAKAIIAQASNEGGAANFNFNGVNYSADDPLEVINGFTPGHFITSGFGSTLQPKAGVPGINIPGQGGQPSGLPSGQPATIGTAPPGTPGGPPGPPAAIPLPSWRPTATGGAGGSDLLQPTGGQSGYMQNPIGWGASNLLGINPWSRPGGPSFFGQPGQPQAAQPSSSGQPQSQMDEVQAAGRIMRNSTSWMGRDSQLRYLDYQRRQHYNNPILDSIMKNLNLPPLPGESTEGETPPPLPTGMQQPQQ